MTAKQTMSAALAWLLCAASPALAEEPAPDEAAVQPPGEVQPRPIELNPVRKPTGTFEIGAGYSTDDGFAALARISQPKLFGSDKGLSLSMRIDERSIESLARYEDPTLFDTDLRLRADLYSRKKLYTGFTREAVGGELSFTRRLAPNLDMFVGYKLEHVTAVQGGTSLFRASTSPEPFWTGGMIGALRFGVEYSTLAEHGFYPRRGTAVGATLEVADGRLGSDLDYVRTDAWLAHHRPLGPMTLHLGTRISTITDVPMSERLHFDGSSDVRGYAPGAIMPEGGNIAWSARGELETPSLIGLSLAGFVDAGGLHAKGGGTETIMSAGVGLIWRSPIGPLRFDWAVPMSGPERDVRFIFGIGGKF